MKHVTRELGFKKLGERGQRDPGALSGITNAAARWAMRMRMGHFGAGPRASPVPNAMGGPPSGRFEDEPTQGPWSGY